MLHTRFTLLSSHKLRHIKRNVSTVYDVRFDVIKPNERMKITCHREHITAHLYSNRALFNKKALKN